jgi:hypothetical protein
MSRGILFAPPSAPSDTKIQLPTFGDLVLGVIGVIGG